MTTNYSNTWDYNSGSFVTATGMVPIYSHADCNSAISNAAKFSAQNIQFKFIQTGKVFNPDTTQDQVLTYINNIPLFAEIQDAIDFGKQYGLEGYHEHTHEGIVGYMAGESHEQSIKAIEGQVIPEAVLRSYQLPEEQITPPMQQLPPPTPPVQTPTPSPTPMPPPDYSSGSSGGSSGGGY
jgi:hypothetical protein